MLKVIILALTLMQPTEYLVEGNDGTYHYATAADQTQLYFVDENVLGRKQIKAGDKVIGLFLSDDKFIAIKK